VSILEIRNQTNVEPVGADLCVRPFDSNMDFACLSSKSVIQTNVEPVGADLCVRPFDSNTDFTCPSSKSVIQTNVEPVGADLCVRPFDSNMDFACPSLKSVIQTNVETVGADLRVHPQNPCCKQKGGHAGPPLRQNLFSKNTIVFNILIYNYLQNKKCFRNMHMITIPH